MPAKGKLRVVFLTFRVILDKPKPRAVTFSFLSSSKQRVKISGKSFIRYIVQDGKAVSGMEATTLLAFAVMSSTIDDELIYQRLSPTHVDLKEV